MFQKFGSIYKAFEMQELSFVYMVKKKCTTFARSTLFPFTYR